MRIKAAYLSKTGARANNEDAILCGAVIREPSYETRNWQPPDSKKWHVAMGDGMGGYDNGRYAAEHVLQLLDESPPQTRVECAEFVTRAHRRLLSDSTSNPALGNHGTTLAALVCSGGRLMVFNVGDSAVFRQNGAFLAELSVCDRSNASKDPDSASPASVLIQALGGPARPKEPVPHIREFTVYASRYVICSDGVTDTLSLEELESIICSGLDPEPACTAIDQQISARGSQDNYSIIILDVAKEDDP